MPITNEFLNEVLGNADTSNDDKAKLILAEHEADVRGLVSKRDELLGKEKSLKEKLKESEAKSSELETKNGELEEQLRASSPEETKKFLENQIAVKEKAWLEEKQALVEERDKFKDSHLKRLRDDAIAEGIKDLQFVDGLKDGFIARVLMTSGFEAKEVDGVVRFLDKNMKEIKDVMHEFALTNEGKSYLKNPSSGGGARGSSGQNNGANAGNNPWKKETENLSEQMQLYRTDRALAVRLAAEAGVKLT